MIRYRPAGIVLVATSGVSGVELSWTDLSSIDATVEYDVLRGLSTANMSRLATTTSATLVDLPPDDTHVWYYRVVARLAGIALQSNIVSAVLTGIEWTSWGQTDIHPFLSGIGASSLKRFADLT